MRTVQVKTTEANSYDVPEEAKIYHILAAVHLVGHDREVRLDGCEVFLIQKDELNGLPRKFSEIANFKLCSERIDALFPRKA